MQRTTGVTLVTILALALAAPSSARAQAPAAPPAAAQARPPGPPPEAAPPAPASHAPPAPGAQPMEIHDQTPPPMSGLGAGPATPMPLPPGQWTYTQQYGWLWMPHDQRYTQVMDDAALAYEYVYYPAFGWSWVVAPWVLGLGVAPYWGPLGPAHFAWYAHPWFRVGTAHLRPSWGPGVGPRGAWRGAASGRMGGGHGRR